MHGRRLLVALVLVLVACGGPEAVPTTTTSLPVDPPTTTTTAGSSSTTSSSTSTTAVVEPVTPSIRTVGVESIETIVVYEQAQRSRLDGRDTFFWPDGNIGIVPLGDGTFRFFAANSTVTARTVGTLDDPGATVEAAAQTIEGVSDEFAYVAGGPVYEDPASGLLLMVYHAERHLDGVGALFHAALGLAASTDGGETFVDLGIIVETQAEPALDAPCCADVGGGPLVVKDGVFHVWFRDRMQTASGYTDVNLALATAPVDEVVAAALAGEVTQWAKYDDGQWTPGIGGTSSPLEAGNPQTSWFSVAYHDGLDRFIGVIARHGFIADPSELYLVSSADGISWSDRTLLAACECEMTYPSIIDAGGDPLRIGDTFHVFHVRTPPDQQYRWHQTPLYRMTVQLVDELVVADHEWDFETDAGGWAALWDIGAFGVADGRLVIATEGNDPYMESPFLGLSTDEFTTIEIVMSSGSAGTGQVFFSTVESPGYREESSIRFEVTGGDGQTTYLLDMSTIPEWDGLVERLRFDPIDQVTDVIIESIRILP